MPNDDDRLRQLLTDVAVLRGHINIAKRMA
jgi:hypothetical protein